MRAAPFLAKTIKMIRYNGCHLSDEYYLLLHAEALTENEELATGLEREELLDEKPDGIVIAKCINGDYVLLLNDGRVIRFGHEEPTELEAWGTLSQFIFDAGD